MKDETIRNPPWRAEDISVGWLNEVLGDHDDFRGAQVSSFDLDNISEDFGFVREVWRVYLDFDDRRPSTPESVVAKFANREPHLKSLFKQSSVREANVYRQLGPESEFIMPGCYFADFDPETGERAILMEDLARGRLSSTYIDGDSEGDTEAVVKAIAVFHARWWGRTDQDQARWLPSPVDGAAIQKKQFRHGAQRFLEKYGEQVDDEFREAISLYDAKLIHVLQEASNPPLTLIHGDLHGGNVFFDTEFRGCPVTAVDWESAAIGKGITDVSNLMVRLNVNLRRAIEDRLVRLYHATLVSEGVAGYSIEQCQADYRIRFLYPFHLTVMVLAYLDLNDVRGQDIARKNIERTSAALRDHDLAGLLRAM